VTSAWVSSRWKHSRPSFVM